MTQKELAESVGVTDKAVSRWETGKGFPDVSLLMTLAAALSVPVSAIIMGEIIKINEESVAEVMDKTIIDTLDYSQRALSKKIKSVLPKVFLFGVFIGAVAVSIYLLFVK